MITSIKQIQKHNEFTAKSLRNICTPRQWASIENAARMAGVDAQDASHKLFDVDYQTLTRANADKLVRHLESLGKPVNFYSIETVDAVDAIAAELAAAEIANEAQTGADFIAVSEEQLHAAWQKTVIANYKAEVTATGARSYSVKSLDNNHVNLVEFRVVSGQRAYRCSCKAFENKMLCRHAGRVFKLHTANRQQFADIFKGKAKF